MELSFEFFPPKSDAAQASLLEAVRQLQKVKPEYVSVTYGAGGSTQDGTLATVAMISELFAEVAPHVSCIGATRADLSSLLDGYQERGIRRMVALRGDLPSGYGRGGEFAHAIDLVRFARERYEGGFLIEVAAYPEGHPQARTLQEDLDRFAEKMKAGADKAITQYFFNSDAYFRFVDEAYARGVDQPIIPGIMPITNFAQLARFSDACGAEIPRWIRARLAGFGDDIESIREFGHEVVTDLVDQLLTAGVPGIHFYSMNRAEPILRILEDLSLRDQWSEAAEQAA